MTNGPAETSAAADGDVQEVSTACGVDAAMSGLNNDGHALVGVRNTTMMWW